MSVTHNPLTSNVLVSVQYKGVTYSGIFRPKDRKLTPLRVEGHYARSQPVGAGSRHRVAIKYTRRLPRIGVLYEHVCALLVDAYKRETQA